MAQTLSTCLDLQDKGNKGHGQKEGHDQDERNGNAGMRDIFVVSAKEESTGHLLGLTDFVQDPSVDGRIDREGKLVDRQGSKERITLFPIANVGIVAGTSSRAISTITITGIATNTDVTLATTRALLVFEIVPIVVPHGLFCQPVVVFKIFRVGRDHKDLADGEGRMIVGTANINLFVRVVQLDFAGPLVDAPVKGRFANVRGNAPKGGFRSDGSSAANGRRDTGVALGSSMHRSLEVVG